MTAVASNIVGNGIHSNTSSSSLKRVKRYTADDIRNRRMDALDRSDYSIDATMDEDNPWIKYFKKQQLSQHRLKKELSQKNKHTKEKLLQDCQFIESNLVQSKQQLKTETKSAEKELKQILDTYIFNKVKETRSQTLTKLQRLFDNKHEKLRQRLKYLTELRNRLECEEFDDNIKTQIEKLKSKKPVNVNIFVINEKQTLDDGFDQIDVSEYKKKHTSQNEKNRMLAKVAQLQRFLKDKEKEIQRLKSGQVKTLEDEVQNLENQLKDQHKKNTLLQKQIKGLQKELEEGAEELADYREERKLKEKEQKTMESESKKLESDLEPGYENLDFNNDITFFCKHLTGCVNNGTKQDHAKTLEMTMVELTDRLTQRSVHERVGICLQYSNIFKGRNLYDDIEIRLKDNINEKCLMVIKSLLQSKHQHDAEQANIAVKESSFEKLANILVTRTNSDIQKIQKIYTKQFGVGLEEETQKFNKTIAKFFSLLLQGSRKEGPKIDEKKVEESVKFLLSFEDGGTKSRGRSSSMMNINIGSLGTEDKEVLITIFATSSEQELKEINKRFQERNSKRKDLILMIQQHPKLGSKGKGYIANLVASYALSHDEYLARYLSDLGKKFDKNINEIARVFVARSELDLGDIQKTFEKRTYPKPGKTMVEWIINNGTQKLPYLSKYLIKIITKLATPKKITTYKMGLIDTKSIQFGSNKRHVNRTPTIDFSKTSFVDELN